MMKADGISSQLSPCRQDRSDVRRGGILRCDITTHSTQARDSFPFKILPRGVNWMPLARAGLIRALDVASCHPTIEAMMKRMRNIFILALSFCLILNAVGGSSASIQSRKLLEVRLYDNGWESDLAALDLLSNELRSAVDSRGYIIIYGARRGRRGEVQSRMTCMKGYMLERRGFRADQITIVHGGFRENATMELWIIRQGACPPVPTPTVAPEDVRFLKGKAKYSCEV